MESESNKEYSVNWKNHMSHVRKAFDHLLSANELTDVTLCCEGKKIRAHKMLLSACSGYFRDTFKDVPCQHPVIILYGVEYNVLSDILRFIYNGEVSVDTARLDAFLKVAQILQISGLTDDPKVVNNNHLESATEENFVKEINEPAAGSTEEAKRPAKRPRLKEPETFKEKLQKPDDAFIADVKCEPNELIDFEASLEDPLQADEQLKEQNDLFDNDLNNFTTEDVKIERTFLESSNLVETDSKVKTSNFSEDCLKCPLCSKVFSHPYSLHHHKAVHSGNTQCPICHAVLSRKYNLKMHMKARHNL